jgi:hypothetical protein
MKEQTKYYIVMIDYYPMIMIRSERANMNMTICDFSCKNNDDVL